MGNKKERGSATIQGVLILPLLVIGFSFFLILMFGFFKYFLVSNSTSQSLRSVGEHWHQDKGLYDDFWLDTDFINRKTVEIEKAMAQFHHGLSPYSADFLEVLPTYEVHWEGFDCYGILNPNMKDLGTGDFFPYEYPLIKGAHSIRHQRYQEQLMNELFDLLENRLLEKDKEKGGQVFIVDKQDKKHDYHKVYHLDKKCPYLRNGYREALSQGKARAKGYRPCRICLGKSYAFD